MLRANFVRPKKRVIEPAFEVLGSYLGRSGQPKSGTV